MNDIEQAIGVLIKIANTAWVKEKPQVEKWADEALTYIRAVQERQAVDVWGVRYAAQHEEIPDDDYSEGYEVGWNDCLDHLAEQGHILTSDYVAPAVTKEEAQAAYDWYKGFLNEGDSVYDLDRYAGETIKKLLKQAGAE